MPLTSFLFGRPPSNGLFEKSKNCVLTTTTSRGEPHARKLRVATCSDDGTHLWFVLPSGSDVAADIARDPHVTLSAIHATSARLMHVAGTASMLGSRHDPLYLAPDFHQDEALGIRGDDLDITLLRVEIDPAEFEDEDAAPSQAARPAYGIFRVFSSSP